MVLKHVSVRVGTVLPSYVSCLCTSNIYGVECLQKLAGRPCFEVFVLVLSFTRSFLMNQRSIIQYNY
jgi:hypothetical protein